MSQYTPAPEGECPNLVNCKGVCFQCDYYITETGVTVYPAVSPQQSAQPVEVQSKTLERAHELGFLRCAGWAQRNDLFSDVSSPAYHKDRLHDLATITVAQPAQVQAKKLLSDLLARIHRDGGQYEEAQGTVNATIDAESRVVRWLEMVDAFPHPVEVQRVGLTDAEIQAKTCTSEFWAQSKLFILGIARAVEAAHGIKPASEGGAA